MYEKQAYMNKKMVIRLGSTIIFCLFLLAACSHYTFATYQEINKELIIPDNYQGFLVVRYNCPDGLPLSASTEVITYRFRHDGTICTRDPVPTTWGQYAIRTHGGKQLVAMGDPWPTTGYGITDAEIYTTAIAGQQMSFEVYWVGNLATHANIRDYDEQLDRFLTVRFGPQ
jgi:hypothetical protein